MPEVNGKTNGPQASAEDEAAGAAALFRKVREDRTWGTLVVEWKAGRVVQSEFKLACRTIGELNEKLGIVTPSEGEPIGGLHGRHPHSPQHLSR